MAANIIELRKKDGQKAIADSGESSVITGQCIDTKTGDPILKLVLLTLKLTLQVEANGEIINSRDDVSILDTAGGTVGDNGEFTLILNKLDNVTTLANAQTQSNIATVTWTWLDPDTVEQDGKQKWRVFVAADVPVASGAGPGWLG